jgi:hypothetical protein
MMEKKYKKNKQSGHSMSMITSSRREIMKNLLTKDELYTHLQLDSVDWDLSTSTKTWFKEYQEESLGSFEDWVGNDNEYTRELLKLDQVIARIEGAFMVLCRLKKDRVLDFRFKDVMELVKWLPLSDSEKYGFHYKDNFYRDVIHIIKSRHKIYVTDK